MNTLQSYLDIPIDHYIEINMKGLEQLSEAIGPVKVDNDLKFTNLDVHFPKGEVTINADNILAYTGCVMRIHEAMTWATIAPTQSLDCFSRKSSFDR